MVSTPAFQKNKRIMSPSRVLKRWKTYLKQPARLLPWKEKKTCPHHWKKLSVRGGQQPFCDNYLRCWTQKPIPLKWYWSHKAIVYFFQETQESRFSILKNPKLNKIAFLNLRIRILSTNSEGDGHLSLISTPPKVGLWLTSVRNLQCTTLNWQ